MPSQPPTSRESRKPQKPATKQTIEALLGHAFADPALLERALTHRSHTYESTPGSIHDPSTDNEQLEFLGDAVLGFVVAQDLVRRFPNSREGELTRLRASLVGRRHLAEVASRIHLGTHLRLGRGEEASGGRQKPALLADAVEALIAALYLDAGLPLAQAFVTQQVIEPALPTLHQALATGGAFTGATGDYKSALQEFLQARGAGPPQYILAGETGPDHCRRFRIEVRLRLPDPQTLSDPLASSEATSKKEAQQEAARLALQHLQTHPDFPLPTPAQTPEALRSAR